MAELPSVDRSIRILTIEADPVIQSGLITCLNRFEDLQVVAEAEDLASAGQVLTRGVEIDLILLGLPVTNLTMSLAFCQQVKASYHNLPILLLATSPNSELTIAFQIGIEGCCLRGCSILDLVNCIRQVAIGQISWTPIILQQVSTDKSRTGKFDRLRQRMQKSSLQQIDATLAAINIELTGNLSELDRAILTGRKRELNTARWLVNRLFPTTPTVPIFTQVPAPDRAKIPLALRESEPINLSIGSLFDRIAAKLQSGLENLTPTALEIDILRRDKKQELFYLILRQFEGLLDELRFSQITIEQLAAKYPQILPDLWASITTDFFGRYHTLSIADSHVELIPTLLQDAEIIRAEILAKIPQSLELFNYLLFKTPLPIDNLNYPVGTTIADERACILLENLVVQIANAVMQPLLNRFGNLESMKSEFYDRRLLSSREIERFRNDLSWRYRIDRYISEPQAIFESQYRLFIFTEDGIKQIPIYAPRPVELSQLAGIPLVVTLTLEVRDALSPRLASLATFFGSGFVYLLTEIIGRGIGLIGRGIIKGIGNIWQETNRNRR